MLLRMAVVLLIGWLLGAVGVYDVGVLVHALLLVGLLLLLLGVLKARETALQQQEASPTTKLK